MKAICVDDEELILQLTMSLCRELPVLDEVYGFETAEETIAWLEKNTTDISVLDIDMPGMNGIKLAERIREKHPDTAILFLTGYAQYAVDAFSVHADGYLLKPIGKERLAAEVEYALSRHGKKDVPRITVRTFGDFDVLVDGQPVAFSRSKAKELLAYLVDRQGGTVTRAGLSAILWEEEPYDRSRQKQLDVIIRSLRDTLTEYGISDIMEMQKGSLRICPEKIDIDIVRLFDGNEDAVKAYHGEYMSSYSWASVTEAYIDRILENRQQKGN